MIECKHKWPLPILNRGLDTQFCTLHAKSVNDTICLSCSDCEGHTPKEHTKDLGFPRRSEEEVDQIRKVCDACPLFKVLDQKCSKTLYEMHPVDIVAQHPNNHCPENLW